MKDTTENTGKNYTKNGANYKKSDRDKSRKRPSSLNCGKGLLDVVGTHFMFCTEKIPGHGEDSGYEAYNENAALLGVFDGCGGLGSRRCPNVREKTEAYLAARTVGNAARQWFDNACENDFVWDTDKLKEYVINNLDHCRKYAASRSPGLRGSLVRPFPSTMAMILCWAEKNAVRTTHIWAGDSRTYILDKDGLGQISVDDINGEDALSNLTKDGALTNVISADKRFVLHSKELVVDSRCILFSATDGCFGYVASPMEFELMILESLLRAENVREWKDILAGSIQERSGDDQTVSLAALGFDSFEELQHYFYERYKVISQINDSFNESGSSEERKSIWETIKPDYYRFSPEQLSDNGND